MKSFTDDYDSGKNIVSVPDLQEESDAWLALALEDWEKWWTYEDDK